MVTPPLDQQGVIHEQVTRRQTTLLLRFALRHRFVIATLNNAIVRHREIESNSLDATPWVRVVGLACGFTGGTPLIDGLLASLRGQSGLQRSAHSRLDGREIGLIVVLNGLPDAPELLGRPRNPARMLSVGGIPDTLDDERTYGIVHTLSSHRLCLVSSTCAYVMPKSSSLHGRTGE
jgi:hypothetical protein